MRNAETTLAIIREQNVAIHRGALTNRLKALIGEGKLTPTGEWGLPSQGKPTSDQSTQPVVETAKLLDCTYWRTG